MSRAVGFWIALLLVFSGTMLIYLATKNRSDNASGSSLTRLAPTLRALFQWREHFSLEGEIAYERSRSDAALVSERNNILFYYLGCRWDF